MAKGEAYYLKHDNDAFSDPKIIKLRMKFGLESYALYWRILEMLFDEPENRLAVEQDTFDLIAFDTRTTLNVEEVISFMIEVGLLTVDEDTDEFHSESLDRRVSIMKGIREARAKAGRRSGEVRKRKAEAKKLKQQTEADVEQVFNKTETKSNNEMRRDEMKGDKMNGRSKPDPIYEQVIEYLNQKAGSRYRPQTASTQRLIRARQSEGYVLDDFKTVIDKKYAEWHGTDMAKYIRPETLFGTKFESYLNQSTATGTRNKGSYQPQALPETYEDNPNDFTALLRQRESEGRR